MTKTIALVGNPNSGKTTLFNVLTGASAHVGNWPGVTVEKKVGQIKKNKDLSLVDLPGIYSLSPYTMEEVIARKYLLDARPDCIINIVDASNLERNLYLTSQVMDMGIPVVLACNMMDLIEKSGDHLDTKGLSDRLGLPVVEISALKEEGIPELVNAVNASLLTGKAPSPMTFSPEIEEAIEKVHSGLSSLTIEPEAKKKLDAISDRWLSVKALELDEETLKDVQIPKAMEDEILALEEKMDDDSQSIISAARYSEIAKILDGVYKEKNPGKKSLTDRIDQIVTNRILALPIFALVIFLVYYLSISTVGTFGTDWVNDVFVAEWLQGGTQTFLENIGVSAWLIGMIVDGVIAGVGAVLGFIPQMAVLFLCLAFLEQTGYMARIAFILDRIFRRFGLSGKSFIPMLIGTGCSVPAIMGSRTIENDKDRYMTAITTSFMPCGAKLPVIAFFGGALFGGAWWFGPIFYFIGIGSVIVSGIILKKTKRFAGDPSPFVMELPEYRLPSLSGILRSVWERCAAFVKKAGTIILLSSIVITTLLHVGFTPEGLGWVDEAVDESILAAIGRSFAWIFKPLGFDTWESAVGTVSGLVAKENLMSIVGIIFGVSGDALDLIEAGDWQALAPITSHYTALSGFSFLLFNLYCAPCFAAIGAMNRELPGRKWTLMGLGYQTLFAYSLSLIFYQGALFFTGGGITIWTIFALAVLLFGLYLLFRPDPSKKLLEGKPAYGESR